MHTHNCVTLLGWAVVSQVTPCQAGLVPHGSLVAVPPEGWHVSHPALFVHPAGPPVAKYRSQRALTSAASVDWVQHVSRYLSTVELTSQPLLSS